MLNCQNMINDMNPYKHPESIQNLNKNDSLFGHEFETLHQRNPFDNITIGVKELRSISQEASTLQRKNFHYYQK